MQLNSWLYNASYPDDFVEYRIWQQGLQFNMDAKTDKQLLYGHKPSSMCFCGSQSYEPPESCKTLIGIKWWDPLTLSGHAIDD